MVLNLIAAPQMVAAVSDIISRQMARALIDYDLPALDLSDEVSCMIRLGCAGFGSASIAVLIGEARKLAGAYRRARTAHKGD